MANLERYLAGAWPTDCPRFCVRQRRWIGVQLSYSGNGRRDLPTDVLYVDGPAEPAGTARGRQLRLLTPWESRFRFFPLRW